MLLEIKVFGCFFYVCLLAFFVVMLGLNFLRNLCFCFFYFDKVVIGDGGVRWGGSSFLFE